MTQPGRNQAVVAALRAQRIELPSWAFGNSGTRFKVFAQKGVPRDPYEKVADAAQVHRFTGVAPTRRAPHPVGQGRRLRRPRAPRRRPRGRPRHDQLEHLPGRRLHARQRLPPGCRASAGRRSTTCSPASTSWTRPARATSSCGSRMARTTRARTTSGPARIGSPRRSPTVHARLGPDQRMRPRVQVLRAVVLHDGRPGLGDRLHPVRRRRARRRKVVVDTGHHAPGTNIEFIVASLLRADRLGGFDFNSRFYADDDLMVGSADPFQLFRIMHEVVQAGAPRARARASRSCSTSATTSSRRSRARSGR